MAAKAAQQAQQSIIYQAKNGAIELRGDVAHDTIWATQAQIVELFGVDQSVVSRHIRNVFKDGEVNQKSNMQKMHIAHSDKPVALYSLDVILSVGYRTNSGVAIAFRQWATRTLREHITKGYTLNRKRIAANYKEFEQAVSDIQALLPAHVPIDTQSVLELVKEFASTWVSLAAYDADSLQTKGATKRRVRLTADMLHEALGTLRDDLLASGEATDIFAQERRVGNVEGIIGNVMQSFGGSDVYATIEEKAAHLLYFMVKNHPFVDGNKRSGAFAFVWFLRRAKVPAAKRITPATLTTLTLLIAESDPKDKEKMVALVTTLLRRRKDK